MLFPILPFHISLPSLYFVSPFRLFSLPISRSPWRHRYGHRLVSRYHFAIHLLSNNFLIFSNTIHFSKLIHPIITRLTFDLHMHIIFVPICHLTVTLSCWGVVLICSRGIHFYFIHIICFYTSDILNRNHCILYKVLSFTIRFDPLSRAQCSFRKLSYIIFLGLLSDPP